MTHQPEPSRHQEISAVAQQMLALGESGRCEFKRDVEAVTVGLLAALANWVAAEPDREVAHLPVGVDEVEDKATGLAHGHLRTGQRSRQGRVSYRRHGEQNTTSPGRSLHRGGGRSRANAIRPRTSMPDHAATLR